MSTIRVNNFENNAGVSALEIAADGSLAVQQGLGLPNVDNTTRPAAPPVGTIVYNTEAKITQVYTGVEVGWSDIGSAAVPFEAAFSPLLSSPSRTGPGSIGSNYAGTPLDGQVSIAGGVQLWTVPYTGTYRIKAWGAQGGRNSSAQGGGGAYLQGDFPLTEGEIIKILIGSPGGDNGKESCDTGGGGGTYVIRSPYNTENSILLIAAGGGGASADYNSQGAGDRTNATGNGCHGKDGLYTNAAMDGPGGAGGSNGYAGNRNLSTSAGNPGGGFYSGGNSGLQNSTWTTTSAGYSFNDGGAGGISNDADSFGGFGGGGGGHGDCFISGGGGGGYNGGGTKIQYTDTHGGCGGGSFNSGANQVGTSGANYNPGGASAFGRVEVALT